jgi:glycosyltransferase involved in cell wall biosynthesis
MMRVAVTLAGTDRGLSGLGTYVRQVVPRLVAGLAARGGDLVAIGTPSDLEAYAECLVGARRHVLPRWVDRPGASAAFHLGMVGRVARSEGASVLLLPAANRRATLSRVVPTVAVVHDLAQLFVRQKYDPARMAYIRALVAGPLRLASSLVAVSRATQADLARALSIRPDSIHVVPNGVDASRFRPSDGVEAGRAELLASLGLPGPFLLYVSRLEHPGKNHVRLVRAFSRSAAARGHRLALAGPDWGAGHQIADEAAACGVSDRIRILGRVDDDALRALMAGADAALMLGLHEGFGLPALEALACGKPVLAARAGALPEVVGDLGVLCDPLDETDIARGLDRVLSDDVLRARVTREGPVWAARHDWDACATSLLDECTRAARAA